GTPSLPNWKMLQLQNNGAPVVEYAGLKVLSSLVDLNGLINNTGSWIELPDLRHNLTVSIGSDIKVTLAGNVGTTGTGGNYLQSDYLIKITPGTTPSPQVIPQAGNSRSVFTVLQSAGNLGTGINAAKALTATVTNYVIQIYVSRNNSPVNGPGGW